jgi:hypothetical protein
MEPPALDKRAQATERGWGVPMSQAPLSGYVPIAGVAIDKLVMLDRGARLPDLHAHLHQHLHITEEDAKEAARQLIAMRNTEKTTAQANQAASPRQTSA